MKGPKISRRIGCSTIVLLVVIFSDFTDGQRMMMRPMGVPLRKGPSLICAYDTLMIIQDCRICHCPRPNRPPQCFRKICDQRTKNTGQCPPAYLNLDDQKVCSSPPRQSPCKTDQQCPGQQICCFDYCAGYKCKNPLPLDNAQAPQQPQYGRFMG